MLELRITVLRDKPSSELLDKYAQNGYNLSHDTHTDLFFLMDGTVDNLELDGFGSEYPRVLNIPFSHDVSYLKAFKAKHSALLKHSLIHTEILTDALALSETLSTRVLCVYSNDEDCDFAVTAENGKLLRLRFQVGRKQGKRVDKDIVEQIETEIHATRVLMGEGYPEDEGVYEYTTFEVIQTVDKPIAVHPYWTYREGEINGQVIFDTITSSPEKITPNLFFRNAFLEFEEAFGKNPPDFTDMPEENRFRRIAFQTPPTVSATTKTSNFIKSLLAFTFSSHKATLWTLGIVCVFAFGIFGNDDEQANKSKNFVDYCVAASGTVSGEFDNECRIDTVTYKNWSLPGVKGERRIMILKIGPKQIPCTSDTTRKCLMVDGEIFYYRIDGFTFRQGKQQIIGVERIQICNPETLNDC